MFPLLSVMNFVTSVMIPCWSGQCTSNIAVVYGLLINMVVISLCYAYSAIWLQKYNIFINYTLAHLNFFWESWKLKIILNSYAAMRQEISQILQIILRGVNNSVSYIWLKCVWKQAFHTHYSYITLATYYIRIKQFTTVATIIHVIESPTVVEGFESHPSDIKHQTSYILHLTSYIYYSRSLKVLRLLKG